MIVAFDIDGTLWKIVPDGEDQFANKKFKQVPDYDLIQVLRWFHSNGDIVYVWSAGGMDYAKTIVNKLGLDVYVTVIDKETLYSGENRLVDLCFDDQLVTLAKVNCKVHRGASTNV